MFPVGAVTFPVIPVRHDGANVDEHPRTSYYQERYAAS